MCSLFGYICIYIYIYIYCYCVNECMNPLYHPPLPPAVQQAEEAGAKYADVCKVCARHHLGHVCARNRQHIYIGIIAIPLGNSIESLSLSLSLSLYIYVIACLISILYKSQYVYI